MKAKRHAGRQIIAVLKEEELSIKVADLHSRYGMSNASCYTPKANHSG